MRDNKEIKVDFIAKSETDDQWKMVLVEEGPWSGPANEELKRIQRRLYDCVDAALDGQLAAKFPESRGKRILIQLDCYKLPVSDLERFFYRFSKGVFSLPEYAEALKTSHFVKEITFEINFETMH